MVLSVNQCTYTFLQHLQHLHVLAAFHFQALMKEVQEHKSVIDTLNEVSSALLELVPWRAREGLDKLITEDNERYRSASDAISQHVDQTGAAILKSQQVRDCKYALF